MSAYADLIERLLFDPISTEAELEAATVIQRLTEALEFYADESAWNQPPVKTCYHELFGRAYENQASKVRLDRGKIARAALAERAKASS